MLVPHRVGTSKCAGLTDPPSSASGSQRGGRCPRVVTLLQSRAFFCKRCAVPTEGLPVPVVPEAAATEPKRENRTPSPANQRRLEHSAAATDLEGKPTLTLLSAIPLIPQQQTTDHAARLYLCTAHRLAHDHHHRRAARRVRLPRVRPPPPAPPLDLDPSPRPDPRPDPDSRRAPCADTPCTESGGRTGAQEDGPSPQGGPLVGELITPRCSPLPRRQTD